MYILRLLFGLLCLLPCLEKDISTNHVLCFSKLRCLAPCLVVLEFALHTSMKNYVLLYSCCHRLPTSVIQPFQSVHEKSESTTTCFRLSQKMERMRECVFVPPVSDRIHCQAIRLYDFVIIMLKALAASKYGEGLHMRVWVPAFAFIILRYSFFAHRSYSHRLWKENSKTQMLNNT